MVFGSASTTTGGANQATAVVYQSDSNGNPTSPKLFTDSEANTKFEQCAQVYPENDSYLLFVSLVEGNAGRVPILMISDTSIVQPDNPPVTYLYQIVEYNRF